MTSSRKGIIRGEDIDGVTFCSPTGNIETASTVDQRETESLRALEEFWYTKGRKEGQDQGFESGFEEGQGSGHKRGKDEGLRVGRSEGEAVGYEKGLEAGRQESIDAFQHAISLLEQAADQMRSERERIFAQVKPELVRFALAVCTKILRQELRDPDTMTALIDDLLVQALPTLRDAQMHVALSSESTEILGERLSSIGARHDVAGLRWIVDKQMPASDVRLEADDGMLHFNLKRQLDELEQKVLEAEDPAVEQPSPAELPEQRSPDIPPTENRSHPTLIPGKDDEPSDTVSETD